MVEHLVQERFHFSRYLVEYYYRCSIIKIHIWSTLNPFMNLHDAPPANIDLFFYCFMLKVFRVIHKLKVSGQKYVNEHWSHLIVYHMYQRKMKKMVVINEQVHQITQIKSMPIKYYLAISNRLLPVLRHQDSH